MYLHYQSIKITEEGGGEAKKKASKGKSIKLNLLNENQANEKVGRLSETNTAMLGGVGAGSGSSLHLLRAEDAPALAQAGAPPSYRAQPPGGTRHTPSRPAGLTANSHPERGLPVPAGPATGAVDALGRVTEG